MVVVELQKELAKEVKKITSGMILKNVKKEETKLNVFEQMLPKNERGASKEKELFPYCNIQISECFSETINSLQIVKVLLILGIFEDSANGQGHIVVLNLIQKIQERFYTNPILAKKFIMNPNIEWALQTEDLYPFYYGAILTEWKVPAMKRKEIGCE